MENFDITLYGIDYQIDFEYYYGCIEWKTGADAFDSPQLQITSIDKIVDEDNNDVTDKFNKKYIEELLSTKYEDQILKHDK